MKLQFEEDEPLEAMSKLVCVDPLVDPLSDPDLLRWILEVGWKVANWNKNDVANFKCVSSKCCEAHVLWVCNKHKQLQQKLGVHVEHIQKMLIAWSSDVNDIIKKAEEAAVDHDVHVLHTMKALASTQLKKSPNHPRRWKAPALTSSKFAVSMWGGRVSHMCGILENNRWYITLKMQNGTGICSVSLSGLTMLPAGDRRILE